MPLGTSMLLISAMSPAAAVPEKSAHGINQNTGAIRARIARRGAKRVQG
jgi:hypothetical protein